MAMAILTGFDSFEQRSSLKLSIMTGLVDKVLKVYGHYGEHPGKFRLNMSRHYNQNVICDRYIAIYQVTYIKQ